MLQLAQVDDVADPPGKGHGQLTITGDGRPIQAFETALDHQHLQLAVGHVLFRQVGAGRDVTSVDIELGDGLQQRVELADAEALAFIGLQQPALLVGRDEVGTLQANRADFEAALVLGGGRLLGQHLAPGQLLEFLQAPALLLEQAFLAVTDQITFARQRRHLSECRNEKECASQRGEQLSHRNHPWR